VSSHNWVVNNEYQARELCNYIMANVDQKLTYQIKPQTRTSQQNKAIYAYCAHVARELDARGKDMQQVVTMSISPTKELVKLIMWDKVQEALFGRKSSADLRTNEVDDVQRVIGRHLAETHDIDVPFGR